MLDLLGLIYTCTKTSAVNGLESYGCWKFFETNSQRPNADTTFEHDDSFVLNYL